ncbi:hypothetical protein O3P69_005220 [Scylla paramamosain]|uniref:DNA helicase MCM8 n=1 Tax=Scylla paramamosain TaxID=85552 RepID=A0AAW0U8Q7_SCYPA
MSEDGRQRWKQGGGGWRGGRGSWRGGGGKWRGRGGNWRGRGGGSWRGQGGNWRGRGGNRRGGSSQGVQGSMPPPSSVPWPPSQPTITTLLPQVPTPYKGWHLYMTQTYSEHSDTVEFVCAFEKYLKQNYHKCLRSELEERRAFSVDLKELLSDEDVKTAMPELPNLVLNSPEDVINCLGLAMHQLLTEEIEAELKAEAEEVLGGATDGTDRAALEALVPDTQLPRIHARLTNHSKVTKLGALKSSHYGKLVSVRGTVVRVSPVKPLCTVLAFSCLGCGGMQGVGQPEGRYLVPSSCAATPGCRSRSFVPERSHRLTHTVDWQTFTMQEIISDDPREGGRIPRTVDCEAKEDLVDSCVPGDLVTVTGVVKVSQSQEGRGSKGDKCMFLLYIDASSVTNGKGRGAGADSASVGIEFSLKDYYAIQEIQAEPNLFRLLVGSLCPSIYGHEMVKAGLLLCLFGGCGRGGKGGVAVRGNSHILVVGDPGLGKSQMLQACANVSPRGVYVCGNNTTTPGLTVTLCREGGGAGDYAMEAGALVLADQGSCCIDEFDKMGSQYQALMEAMEQQTVSIAKAGVLCTLPARTSILAAANPCAGHYNRAKTVSENLRLKPAMLSRFDLIFVLLDKPDEELDCRLSEHVMALHSGMGGKMGHASFSKSRNSSFASTSSTLDDDDDKPLSEYLKQPTWEPLDPVPHQLLRKYICYARRYVHPRLSPAAAKVLQEFYLDLRQNHVSDAIPITTRQLESLVRLTQARARCELREEATGQDAQEVIEVMRFSMKDAFADDLSLVEFQMSLGEAKTGSRGPVKKFIAGLTRLSEKTCKSTFSVNEMKQLIKQMNLKVPDFGDFLSTLNHHGYLIKKGQGVYRLSSFDC